LKYSSYDNKCQRKRYRARKEDSQGCPLKEKCCPDANFRNISRTIYYQEYERLESRLTVSEGLFAEAKTNHSLRKFMTRGIENAQKNSYMIASVQNLKRLMKGLGKKGKTAIKISEAKQERRFLIGDLNIIPLAHFC